jgi:glucan phosphoethanolaminetransferase (alkaline phosphatase superfamily)
MNVLFATGWWLLWLTFLWKRRWWWSAAAFVAGLGWLLYSPSVLKWIEHLGSDSFSEVQNFDWVEAIDLVKSLRQILRRESFATLTSRIGLGLLLASALYAATLFIVRRWRYDAARTHATAAWILIAISLMMQFYPAVGAFQSNSDLYRNVFQNFHAHDRIPLLHHGSPNELNVVVYIGESTSSLNLGIYGYPRPTTPELAAFQATYDGVLVFHNVFSTHVHTAPSLLEALSIGVHPSEDFLPIGDRQRVSVVDLLQQAGIPSVLISNQGRTGTWNNLATTVVFRTVDERIFSFNSTWLGEMEHGKPRPLDHEFLVPMLERRGDLRRRGPRVVFLHSYAGHGPYLRNIDRRFSAPVDDFLSTRSPLAVVGGGLTDPVEVVRTIDAYDSTVRYIDHSLVSALQSVKAAAPPAVLIYFSDHGDAVYAGRRHDSARFVHEMARVPFIMYFNASALRQYPQLFERFQRTSQMRRVSTLAQFPMSLLELLGLTIESSSLRGVGQSDIQSLPPILTRETHAGYSYIRLGTQPDQAEKPGRPREVSDTDTALFRAARQLHTDGTQLCRNDSSTIGKALRAAIVADCLSVEVSIGDHDAPVIRPSPNGLSGLDLQAVVEIARGYGRSLWISGEDLGTVRGCGALDSFLNIDTRKPLEAMVMFPSDSSWRDGPLRLCIDSLRSKGFRTGYEISGETIRPCSANHVQTGPNESYCTQLSESLEAMAASGAFTDIGFDFSDEETVERVCCGASLAWNAWNVSLSELNSRRAARLRSAVIHPSPDPNNRDSSPSSTFRGVSHQRSRTDPTRGGRQSKFRTARVPPLSG